MNVLNSTAAYGLMAHGFPTFRAVKRQENSLAGYYRLFQATKPDKAKLDIEILDAFSLACAYNFIFLDLAF